MTFGQLGWTDALGFAFGMILEIPSGAIADLIGKRKTILFGAIAGVVGTFLMTFSGSYMGMTIGWLITQICYAFYSGAAEALAYDTLVDLHEEERFDAVITKVSGLESYATAASAMIGGFIYDFNNRLPHVLWWFSFIVLVVLAYFLIEPKVDTEKFSLKKYLHQLGVGFKELTHTSLRKFIGFFFILSGIYYMYSWGFIRPAIATSFGFFAKEQAIIVPALTLLGAISIALLPKIRERLSDSLGLTILSIMMAGGFIMSAYPVGYFGLIAMILIAIAGKFSYPWISIIINKKIESQYRATTLSTVALFTKIPYVLLAVVAGKMIQDGKLGDFNLRIGLFTLIVALLSLTFIKLPKILKTN